MRTMPLLMVLCLLSSAAMGQTTGVPGVNDFTLNGNGSGGTSPTDPGLDTADTSVTFEVTTAGGNVIVGATGTSQPGALPLAPPYSVDISLGTLSLWLAPGTQLGFLISTTVDATGTWSLSIPTSFSGGEVFTFQFGILDPVSGSISTTQCQTGTVTAGCPPSLFPNTIGGDIALTDDCFVAHMFVNPAGFTFYGAAYNTVFVNMNGNLTFTAGNTDFTPSETDLLSAEPRIAACFDDFTPDDPNQGTVRVFDDGTVFEVEWFEVRNFGVGCTSVGDLNTFGCQLNMAQGFIDVKHGDMDLCNSGTSPSVDSIVGISPGSNLSLPNNVDLTLPGGSTGAGPLDAIYEDFGMGIFGVFDLGNQPSPNCTSTVLFVPSSVPGSGPYAQIHSTP